MKLGRLGTTVIAIVAALVLVTVVLSLLLPTNRAELPSVIQTCAVILSLAVATAVFLRDSRDKRTDRVHQLHKELTTGEVGEARARLGHFLRSKGEGDLVRVVSVTDLEIGNSLGAYGEEDEGHHPRRDAALVLRFFERAHVAQSGGAVIDAPFAALVGYHAIWWALAIEHKGAELTYSTLELALWADRYITKHKDKRPELQVLTSRRARDFPSRELGDLKNDA